MSATGYVCELTKKQIDKLKGILEYQYWELATVQYAHWQARKNKTTITAYTSGKVSMQGKGTAEVVQFIIEPYISKEFRFGYESEWTKMDNPKMLEPHSGIDESGKGDYFGPLVIAAVFVTEESARVLIDAGIQDSKNIKSDKKMAFLAQKVKTATNGGFALVSIGNEAYNRMYDKLKNINKILAWGHARSLENLLEKRPECKHAISDRFGRKSTVLEALMSRGKKIHLEQYTKAESDVAVAAASIVARDEFVKRLGQLGDQIGKVLPKGASSKVVERASEIISEYGEEELGKYAKLHFRITEKSRNSANKTD